MIAGNVPGHLIAGARTGFLSAIRDVSPLWQRVAMTHNMTGKSTDLVDLGAAPMPSDGKTGVVASDFIERTMTIQPKDWTLTTWISHNAIEDDRVGDLETKVRGAGANFNKHINQLVFKALNAGDAATYGLCYDGLNFFSSSHVDKGAAYATAQSNINDLALSLDNFDTVYVAASGRLDDQGELTGLTPNLLVVPPALQRTAMQITANPKVMGSANNDLNPYAGNIDQIVVPYIDSTAWFLLCGSESIKPIILIMREQPNLQSSWFDPQAPEGGRYYFKFYARYNVAYSDWRLATMGKS